VRLNGLYLPVVLQPLCKIVLLRFSHRRFHFVRSDYHTMADDTPAPNSKIRNTIFKLYFADNLKLEGDGGVIDIMKKEHGYSARYWLLSIQLAPMLTTSQQESIRTNLQNFWSKEESDEGSMDRYKSPY
jgi:hypothetical protein